MGSLELQLLLKYGIPLAIKLLKQGKDEDETIDVVNTAIVGIASGEDIGETLVTATPEQAKSIIDGLFGVITGAGDALGNLIKAFFGIFKK